MAYEIKLTATAVSDLKAMRVFDQRQIVDEMNRQLMHQPTAATRNRKAIEGVAPDFEYVPPLWELSGAHTVSFMT